MILVDGHSTDGTPEVARQLMPSIRVVNLTRKGKGKGNALACGFAAATGDITRLRSLGNKALGLIVNTMYRTRYTDLC